MEEHTATIKTIVQSDTVQAIQHRLENITERALEYAEQVFYSGTTEQKTALTRTILGGAMKVVGSDAAEVEQEARIAIESIWSRQRELPDAVDVNSVDRTVNHSNEVPYDGEVPDP
jgi:hypothetical protein